MLLIWAHFKHRHHLRAQLPSSPYIDRSGTSFFRGSRLAGRLEPWAFGPLMSSLGQMHHRHGPALMMVWRTQPSIVTYRLASLQSGNISQGIEVNCLGLLY